MFSGIDSTAPASPPHPESARSVSGIPPGAVSSESLSGKRSGFGEWVGGARRTAGINPAGQGGQGGQGGQVSLWPPCSKMWPPYHQKVAPLPSILALLI